MQERKIDFGSSHWLDLTNPSENDLNRVASSYGLHPQLVSDSLDPEHLPQIQRSDGFTYLILRSYDENSPKDATTVQDATRKIVVLWGDKFFLTIHRAPLPWLSKILDAWERKAQRDPGQFASLLNEVIEECLFTYESPIDEGDVALDAVEDAVFAEKHEAVTSKDLLETVYVVKKRADIFKRMLRLTRDVVPQVSKLGEPNSPALQNLKEEADRLFYYADDLVESANDLVNLSITITTNRTNEIVRMLTIVSIFILPLNVVTGIYGMNFRNMPELDSPYGYFGALLFMAALVAGIWIVLKKRGWIR